MINSTLFKKIILLNDRWFKRNIQCSKNLEGNFYVNCKNCFGELTNMREYVGYDNYNCENLTYYYVCSHLNTFTSQIFYALNSDFLKSELKNLKEFNILSLGCGATPDFIAFDSFNKNRVNINYTGVDRSYAWKNNHECIKVYSKYNNYSEPKISYVDVMDYVSEKQNSNINIIIIQNIISTFAKSGNKNMLNTFISNLFSNIVLNSSENIYIIVNDVNHVSLYRDDWMRMFIEKATVHNFKTNKLLFDGYEEIENCKKYSTNDILFEYPEKFDINDNYNKPSNCMKYVQLLIKKG